MSADIALPKDWDRSGLPGWTYFSQELFELECETLFKTHWQFVCHVNEAAEGTMFTAASCNSWYLGANIPGKPRIFMPYVGGVGVYRETCDRVAANDYEGFVLSAS